MERVAAQISRVIKRLATQPTSVEVLYVNQSLLNDRFAHLYGGVTKFLESVQQTDEVALKAEAGAEVGWLLKMLLNIKASVSAEGRIGEKTTALVEKELTLHKRIALCEAALEDRGLVVEDALSLAGLEGKYLRVAGLRTYTAADEAALSDTVGKEAARVILEQLQRDQALTPATPQVVLVTAQPVCMAGVIQVQAEVQGSTYIAYPPPPPAQRFVLAEKLEERSGVAFLKTLWVLDKRNEQDCA